MDKTPTFSTVEDYKTLESALNVLKVGKNRNPNNILQCYQLELWAAEQNRELSEVGEQLFSAWRTVGQHLTIKQLTESGKFDLSWIEFTELEGVKKCDGCGGTGERYKFHRKPVAVECLKCKTVTIKLKEVIAISGTTITLDGQDVSNIARYKYYLGRVVEDCTSCGGSGRYITKDEEFGGNNNVLCKTCKGKIIETDAIKTQILIKCKTCKGKRTIKIPVIAPPIKSTTTCKKCYGKGFVSKKQKPVKPKELKMLNPVLNKNLGDIIKKQL